MLPNQGIIDIKSSVKSDQFILQSQNRILHPTKKREGIHQSVFTDKKSIHSPTKPISQKNSTVRKLHVMLEKIGIAIKQQKKRIRIKLFMRTKLLERKSLKLKHCMFDPMPFLLSIPRDM